MRELERLALLRDEAERWFLAYLRLDSDTAENVAFMGLVV